MATAHPQGRVDAPPADGVSVFRVVIVEDSPLVARRIEEALSDIGNVVVVATMASEAEARTVLGACRWDFLILDLQLKDGNGLNVLRALQPDAQSSRRIAVVTTFASAACARESMALGASYFFDKAYDLPSLMTLIRTLAA